VKPAPNSLHAGDCLEIMRQWDDACIDHCITDPPYNMSKKNGLGWAFSSHVTMSEDWDIYPRAEYLDFTRAWLREVCRVVKPNGNIFIFGSYHNIYDIGSIIQDMNLKILNHITWSKKNAQPNITARMLTESTEHIIWAVNGSKEKATGWTFNYKVAKALNGGKQLRNVWEFPYPSKTERRFGKHPSQKPLKLIGQIVLIASKPGDVLLDCFAGSGTLGVVTKSFDRRYVMIETSDEYRAIIDSRLTQDSIAWPDALPGGELTPESTSG
jgi:site-specific DNA-methyltransferase (adenine-specific)